MTAMLIVGSKEVTPDGDVIEVVVWRVPTPVPPSHHDFRYRAVYVAGSKRVIGFDNERGKGDHMHIGGREQPYFFTTIEQMIEDFIAAVDTARRRK